MSSAVRQWFSEKQMQGFPMASFCILHRRLILHWDCNVWSYHKFAAAYGFIAGANIWAILCWQFSDFLVQKRRAWARARERADAKPKSRPKQLKNDAAKHSYIIWCAGLSTLIVGIAVLCIAWIHADQVNYELSQLNGVLYPANDQVPPEACSPHVIPVVKYFN
jgi:hypothetical protein